MIMNEERSADSELRPDDAPTGAAVGALPRSQEQASRERIARRIEASALETERRSA